MDYPRGPWRTQYSGVGIDGGNIVGKYTDSFGADHGFVYDGVDWTTLTKPWGHGPDVVPFDIDGEAIVGSIGAHGFLYDPEGVFPIVPLPGAALLGMVGLGYAGMRLRRRI